MRTFQRIIAVITILMMAGVVAISTVVNSALSNNAANPGCFMGVVIITAVLVFITGITSFIRK